MSAEDAAIAKAGIGLYGAAAAVKAKQEEQMANAKIAQQSRNIGFNRDTQAYLTNLQNLKEQTTELNVNIELASAAAQDSARVSGAGSGISGASVDEVNTSITRAVGADKAAAAKNYANQKDAASMQLKQTNENRVREAELAQVYDPRNDLGAAVFNAAASAAMGM